VVGWAGASTVGLRITLAVLAASLAALLFAAGSAGATQYVIGVPVCARPANPDLAQCFAMRRAVVNRSTPGAEPLVRGDGVRPSSATIGPDQGLTPLDLSTAYGFNPAKPVTQTIALVDAFNDPRLNADLQTFDNHYGLPKCSIGNGCLRVVNQRGNPKLPPNDGLGWAVEEALDVETAHAVCQTCRIVLYEANDQTPDDLGTAENTAVASGATEVSNSFGFQEQTFTATDVADFDHPGTVITAATGDDGYYDFDFLGETGLYNQDNAPSSLRTVVSVGGTSLLLDQTGARQEETVWNTNGIKNVFEETLLEPLGATGGGCSTTIGAPQWQRAVAGWSETGCGSKRLVADISAVADPTTGFDIYLSYDCGGICNTGWLTIGGTSLSSPLVAGLFALAGGAHGVHYPALTLYAHQHTSGAYYDVTTGGNGYCGGEGAAQCGNPNRFKEGILDCDYPATGTTPSAGDRACDALAGFDGPSGLGTPNGLRPFAQLTPTAKISGPSTVAHGALGTWNASGSDPYPGGHPIRYVWHWGDGTSTTTTAAGTTHAYAAAANRTITLSAVDNFDQAATATFRVRVS
jgi:hypothetical protein